MDKWAVEKLKMANESGERTPNADVKTEPGVTDVQQKITPWIQDIELEKKSCEGERVLTRSVTYSHILLSSIYSFLSRVY